MAVANRRGEPVELNDDFRYVVLFNVPEWEDREWGYTGLTVFDTRHEAVGAMATLRRKNPDTDYKLEVFG